MKRIILFCLLAVLHFGCKKEHGSQVDLYLLKSFSTSVNTATNPATISITNAVLESTPLVADKDIDFYQEATTTFVLKKDIQTAIQHFGSDKAFAVTVNGKPVYYGKFHPLYLSSMTIGVPIIAPLIANPNELKIDFVSITGYGWLQQLDKRNDNRILHALKETGRLR